MITLREFVEEDITQLIDWVVDEKFLLTWAGPAYKYPLTSEQLKRELEKARTEKTKMIFAVMDTKLNEVIGHIQLLRIDRDKKNAFMGRVLVGNSNNRNKGIGVEMIKCLLKKCFKDLNFKKVGLFVFEYNKSAIACYKKIGFEVDEILKDAREYNGQKLTLLSMSITAKQFKE